MNNKIFIHFKNNKVKTYTNVTTCHSNNKVLYFWCNNGNFRIEYNLKDINHYILKQY